MLNTFLLFATEMVAEAPSSAHEGFGLNLNPLQTNLINLAILVGLLVFYGRKVLTQLLGERQSKIAEAIQEVENRKNKAAVALAEEQKKLAQAKTEAERIRSSAQERAQTMQTEIAAQAERDVQRLKEAAAKDLTAEQERVMAELKQRIAALALTQVESTLKSGLDGTTQQELINRSLAQLGGK